MCSDAWYYYRAGKRFGPIPLTELKALIDDGQLPKAVRVYRKGMTRWTAAIRLPEFGAENVTAISPLLTNGQFTESRSVCGGEVNGHSDIDQPYTDDYDKRLDEIAKTEPRYAGFWVRFAAKLFDVFVLFVVFFSVGIAINLCFGLPMIVDDKRMNPSDANRIVAAKMLSKIFDIIVGCL